MDRMNRINVVSVLLGAGCYFTFLLAMFFVGLPFIFGIWYLPFLYLFPELKNPNAEMAGLPFYLLSIMLGIFSFPILFGLVTKALKVKVSLGLVMIGFLLSALVASVVKLVIDVMSK